MDLLIINGHDYSKYVKKSGFGWSRNDLDSDKSTRTKNGTLRRDKIATKRSLSYDIMGMTRDQLAQLDDDLSEPTFSATYEDLHGKMNKTFYCSSFSATLNTTTVEDGNSWTAGTFMIIEV